MASHAVFNLVDLLLVGRLGEGAVAGVHVASTINFLPMILGNGISIATLSLMARMLGAGDEAGARDLSSRSQSLMLLIGLVVGAVGAALAVPCVDLQGVTGDARQTGIHYLVVTSLGTFTMFVVMQTTASMRALGESAMPFALLVGANVLNLILDWILLFGWADLAIPAFGAPGAAYATVISRGVAGVVGLWWLSRPNYPLRFALVPFRGPRGQRREILRLGVPQSLQMLVRAMTVIALTRIAGDLGGQDAIVALGVATRLDTMVLFSALGFASAATTLAGRSYGAGEFDRVRTTCRWAGLAAMAFSAVLVTGFAVYARPLIAWFVSDASEGVLAAGALYLSIAALGQPLAAFCIAMTGGINGTGRVLPPMLIDIVGYLGILLPAVIVVASVLDRVELALIWWIFAATNLLLAIAYWIYVQRVAWQADGDVSDGATRLLTD